MTNNSFQENFLIIKLTPIVLEVEMEMARAECSNAGPQLLALVLLEGNLHSATSHSHCVCVGGGWRVRVCAL